MKRAGFGVRLAGYLIDLLILSAVDAVLIGGLIALGAPPGLGLAVFFVVGVAYGTFFIGSPGGQTVGMKAVSIRAITEEEGGRVTHGAALGRHLMSLVSQFVFWLGYLNVLWDREKQTWHDKTAGTYVVPVAAVLSAGPMPREGVLLELRDVEAGYGPFRALFGVSLAVREGSVLALLGSNGAGKTTVARICSGLIKPTAGTFFFDGQDVTGRRAYSLARMGIAQAPEGRSVFASLTVEENLQLSLRGALGRTRAASGLARAYELFPPLSQRRRQVAGTLSGGEQRMLALARVLAKPPRLLVCDELSLGLAPIVVDEVYRTLRTIRDAGTTLLIVEQHVGHALSIADDVAVLVRGRVTYDGSVDEMGDLGEWLLPTGEAREPSPNGQ